MIRVSVCGCLRVCAFECWDQPHFSSFYLWLLCLLLLLPYHVVCTTPFLKLSSFVLCGSHGTTAVAQQFCVNQFYVFIDSIFFV